jgi:hypothetical protein
MTPAELAETIVGNPDAVAKMLSEADAACKAADMATKNVAAMFALVLNRKLPVGSVIDLRKVRELPAFLRTTRTVKGNDRRTKTFRIEGPFNVSVDPRLPINASWSCLATPISEITGKDMVAAASNSRVASEYLTLSGSVLADPFTLENEEYIAACEKQVTDFFRS